MRRRFVACCAVAAATLLIATGACSGGGVGDAGERLDGLNEQAGEVAAATEAVADGVGSGPQGAISSDSTPPSVSEGADGDPMVGPLSVPHSSDRPEPDSDNDDAAATPDEGPATDVAPDVRAPKPGQAEARDSSEAGDGTPAEPLTPEELVSQRWPGMEWPNASVADLGLSTDLGSLEIIRHTGPELHSVSMRVAHYWLESAGGTSPSIVLVPGTSWPEIAAAASLAGRLDAPMLVVPADGLGPQALAMLDTARVQRAVLVGDHGAALRSALPELDALDIAVEQAVEDDLYATAAAVAEHLVAGDDPAGVHRTAIITSAAGPAAAVVAASLAATRGLPLLFSPAESLHAATAEFFADHRIEFVLLVGTTDEFSAAVTEALVAAGIGVVAVSADTPAKLALHGVDASEESLGADPRCTASPSGLAVASPHDPLTALAAVPLVAQSCAPLVYVGDGTLPPRTRNDIYLARHSSRGAQVHVFADTEHILDSTVDATLPPIRLAFPVTDPALPGSDNTMAIVDEHRNISLHLQGADFSGINWLAWSPSAPQLAFAATHHGIDGLFLLEPETGATRRLSPPDRALRLSTWAPARWSPTGRHIAMSAYDGSEDSDPDQAADLYLIDIVAGTFQVLAASEDHDQFIYWSPTGDRILFLRHDQFGTPLGWMPHRDRVYLADVTDRTVTAVDLDGQALWDAAWSPDSNLIAMALVDDETLRTGGLGTPRVHLFKSDQTSISATGGHLADGYVLGWSADGSRLAISQVLSDGSETSMHLAVLDMGTGDLIDLGKQRDGSGNFLTYAGWLPTGNVLVLRRYDSDTRNTNGLLLLNTDDQSSTIVGESVVDSAYGPFGFSPDGSQIGSEVFAQGMRLIVATDTRSDGSDRLLLDATEYTGYWGGELWADAIFRWDESGLSGTIEWYADY